jgi:hypothetical protein
VRETGDGEESSNRPVVRGELIHRSDHARRLLPRGHLFIDRHAVVRDERRMLQL